MLYLTCPFCNKEVTVVEGYSFDKLGNIVHTCEGGVWELAYESFENSDLSYFYLEKQ